MADELRADGRAFDIRFSRGYRREQTNPRLGYGFRDGSATRHYSWKELFPYPAGNGYGYDGWVEFFQPNDPSHHVKQVWEAKCRVSALLYTQ